MFRDATYNDLTRAGEAAGAAAEFVMDEEAFRSFYERNARPLWAYLVRATGDRAQAEDLLQETFFRFLRAAAAHESEAHRRHSLYRIATNLLRDAHRRRALRAGSFLAGHDIDSFASSSPTPEPRLDLHRALDSLKPRDRALLWMAYAEGASHQEIAGMFGLRPGSLRPLLFRIRKKVAGLLGRQEAAE